MFGEQLYKIRKVKGLSQEELANMVGVTRQALQKWENGTSKPDVENLTQLIKCLHISADVLLKEDTRSVEELRLGKPLAPSYKDLQTWDTYQAQLHFEYRQCLLEGKDFEKYKEVFDAVSKLSAGTTKARMAEALFEYVCNSKMRTEFAFVEPDVYEDIEALYTQSDFVLTPCKTKEQLKSKIKGAWLGRICGCLLGKPLECRHTNNFVPMLKRTGNYPMHRYVRAEDYNEEDKQKLWFEGARSMLVDYIDCAPVDDDTNYMVMAYKVIEQYGHDFTPQQVLESWVNLQGKNAYCTAERVAYLNYILGYMPPFSAVRQNPYREWIGAQIRTDYYGYIAPCKPKEAAYMAYKDASISHVKNGIYGGMFVSALLSIAASTNVTMIDAIKLALCYVPKTSRFYRDMQDVIHDFEQGVSQQEAIAKIHKEYDEHDEFDWCHVLSNAKIVVACLLYAKDYVHAVGSAVEAGFDTDCNGATVGSVYGMMYGESVIPASFTAPLHNTLDTSLIGMSKVDIEDMVDKTMGHIMQ